MHLTDDFIKQYDTIEAPFGGNGLGYFVYLRTYSRWLEDKGRRETWNETVRRVVEYSMSLYQGPATTDELQKEAEELYDSIYNLRVFPAGRTLWIGGTKAARAFGSSNFNCAFVVMDTVKAFNDLFYLLMVGSGVGFRILFSDVAKLPSFNERIVVAHKPYNGKTKSDRREDTVVFEEKDETNTTSLSSVHIVVGDSKGGWVRALEIYLDTMQRKDVESIIFNYDSVRPMGEVLKTFGGRSSGHQALKNMFRSIHKVMQRTLLDTYKERRLLPIDVLDICNYIGANVVVGGVRRTSQIALFDINDGGVLNAKVGLWEKGSYNFGNDQRSMSNNSIFFEEKPTKEQLLDIFQRIQHNGEPGFVNAQAARLRRPNFQGLNPCAEILLDDQGVCNLTEVNLTAFVDTSGAILLKELQAAVRHATRVGLRQTNITLDLPEWDVIQKRDRLIGVSLDGVMDFSDSVKWKNPTDMIAYTDGVVLDHPLWIPKELKDVLVHLKSIVHSESRAYAYEMRIPEPLLATTIKPSGSLSKLPTISSGVHRARAPYFIRRVRITASDPLAKAVYDIGLPVYPETNSEMSLEEFKALPPVERWNTLQRSHTWVIEFANKSHTRVGIDNESAKEQFSRYLLFQQYWTDHNTSITINFAPDEVESLVDMILEHWDAYIAVSFLPKDIRTYPLLPEEPITEEEYNARVIHISPDMLQHSLQQYEFTDLASDLLDSSCDTGICPVR